MNPLKKIVFLFFVLLINYSCAVRQQQQPVYNQEKVVDYQMFYDQLSPYGNWVNYSNYGYVWIPDVRREFAPYSTNGNWVMTDYGWTWLSDYKWGWAPFHYGRWDYDDYYGWLWVPGNEWGPAWVTWRSGNGYYGWAPMRPGMNVNSNFNDGYRDINRWNFVRDRDFGRNDIQRYYVNRNSYNTIINNTTILNNTTVDRRRNTTYDAGPQLDNVQNATGRNINRVRIQDNNRPGQKLNNKELTIFRPQINRNTNRNLAPAKITDIEQIKPVRQRGSGNPENNMTPIDNTSQQRPSGSDQRTERRRSINQQRQQQTEKSNQIQQNQPVQPQANPGEEPYQEERRRTGRQQNQQNQQIQNNKSAQPTQQGVPQSTQSERDKIQQEQIEQQDRTKQEQVIKQQQQQVQRQQQQVERQQQQIERQQQIQRRKQERQTIRQKQPIEQNQSVPQSQTSQQQKEEDQKSTPPSVTRRR